ncbi:neutral zinc metallopeptidase [Skermanella mucosa]|uniref:KPN_02809 family neutral zinc metallopeptidase n=1 Tax=Skermanella mucosa TaxID=1789672 RepID=UPI00192BB83B|nr:neutral zinc metallopeptidase [Skermanella mucosa]UEM22783.1 neutral zinc metallopeptidase [Skermanella mucosa]
MQWRGRRQSDNIEDRRGTGPVSGSGLPGGMLGGRGMRRGGFGLVGTVVILLLGLVFGFDPSFLLNGGSGGGPGGGYVEAPQPRMGTAPGPRSGGDQDLADFVSVVLAETEDVWGDIFAQSGRRYEEPVLVLFSGAVQSACGFAQAAMGPFYCPADRKLYIDLSFYRDLRTRMGAPGDFAQAYVVAHEVGHHVQNLLGVSGDVQAAQRQSSRGDANALSVRLELQADCFAGIWAFHLAQQGQILEPGDIDEALNAASAVGDDRLQERATGRVTPDSFTHGSSAQRVEWFRRGLESGAPTSCDTFQEG